MIKTQIGTCTILAVSLLAGCANELGTEMPAASQGFGELRASTTMLSDGSITELTDSNGAVLVSLEWYQQTPEEALATVSGLEEPLEVAFTVSPDVTTFHEIVNEIWTNSQGEMLEDLSESDLASEGAEGISQEALRCGPRFTRRSAYPRVWNGTSCRKVCEICDYRSGYSTLRRDGFVILYRGSYYERYYSTCTCRYPN